MYRGSSQERYRRVQSCQNRRCISGVASHVNRLYVWVLRISLLLWATCSGVLAYTLRVRVQPGRGTGGEAFLEQPHLEILEGDGGDIDKSFQVSAVVIAVFGVVSSWSWLCRERPETRISGAQPPRFVNIWTQTASESYRKSEVSNE